MSKPENVNKYPLGIIKKNDGAFWIVKKNRNGKKAWYKFEDKGKIYITMDDGASTYTVYVNKKGDKYKVDIYILYENKSKNIKGLKLVKEYTVTKVFVGKSSKTRKFQGISLLLQLNKNRYVFVGFCLYEFSTLDEIKKYYSPFASNLSPYPVAVGTDNVYFMLDFVYINKDEFADVPKKEWEELYGYYYGHLTKDPKHYSKHAKKMKNKKIIHK